MKLILLTSLYPPVAGGAELQAQNLARHCTALGVPVTVVTQPQPGAEPELWEGNVRVMRSLHALSLGPLWGLSYMASTWRALDRLVDHETVIHNQQVSLHSWVSRRVASMKRIPLVLRFACAGRHGDLSRLKEVFYGRYMLPALRGADRCIVLSGELREELVAEGFPREIIRYRPNGVDTTLFHPADQRAGADGGGPLQLLFVGRLDPQKGIDTLLQALARIPGDLDWRLQLYGSGPQEAELHRICTQLGLDGRIAFAGTTDAMDKVYRQADLLVHPSLHEGMPNVVLEALASGLPVLATDIGGNRELLQEWAPDWLVPAADADALAEGILRAIQQRPALADLGARARREAETKYAHRALAEAYLRDCENLLRCSRGR